MHHPPEFMGIGTVGERGQVSIPAEARKRAGIEPGDKLVFLAMDKDALVVMNADRLDALFADMATRAERLHTQVREAAKRDV